MQDMLYDSFVQSQAVQITVQAYDWFIEGNWRWNNCFHVKSKQRLVNAAESYYNAYIALKAEKMPNKSAASIR